MVAPSRQAATLERLNTADDLTGVQFTGSPVVMATRRPLDDRQWAKLAPVIDDLRTVGRRGRDDRNVAAAVLWIHRTGAPWRDLPGDFGPWKTIYNRVDRWSRTGRWPAVFTALADDVDGEWHALDSTVNRAHQHSAGGKGGPWQTRSGVPVVAAPRQCI